MITAGRPNLGRTRPTLAQDPRWRDAAHFPACQTTGVRFEKGSAARAVFRCQRCGADTDAPPHTARAGATLCRDCFGKGVDRRPHDLNDLTGSEWARASRSVEQYPDIRSEKQRAHGASFPLSLARQQVQIFTKSGAVVLDPFVGVGTTLDACAQLGRLGIGLDLNRDFIAAAQADLDQHFSGGRQRLIHGDALRLDEYVAPDTVDFLLTSPPYGSLLNRVKGSFAYKWREHSTIDPTPNPAPYSDNPRDLGNLDYRGFLDALSRVLSASRQVLRANTYAVWVIKDFRALKDGVPYVNFHGHFIERAESAGFTLWDLRIYDQTKYRPLVCLGYPSGNFYLNIGHSYLVVLKRP